MATLDQVEKVARIVSLMAVPIIVGVIGYEYQSAERDKSLALEYVKLSIEVVRDKNTVDPYVHDWAVDTLNHYSQVKMTKELEQSLKKGTSSVDVAPPESNWFAVVASVSTPEEANRLANELKSHIPADLGEKAFGLYKTKISNSYALTIGHHISKAEALRRARIARDSGWVPDAFAQRDLQWDFIKDL
jgi:hypothetical protein